VRVRVTRVDFPNHQKKCASSSIAETGFVRFEREVGGDITTIKAQFKKSTIRRRFPNGPGSSKTAFEFGPQQEAASRRPSASLVASQQEYGSIGECMTPLESGILVTPDGHLAASSAGEPCAASAHMSMSTFLLIPSARGPGRPYVAGQSRFKWN
jgi:hypothetical protein